MTEEAPAPDPRITRALAILDARDAGMRRTREIRDAQAGIEIEALAALSAPSYEAERGPVAERLGMRVSALDRLVDAERRRNGAIAAAPGQGRPLNLADPEPWPEPVDGAALLNEMAHAIRSHVVLRPAEADAVALWAAGTHAMAAWGIYSRLFMTAPEKGCGKTTLLDVISRLVPRALSASNITAASLFRTIEAARPTLLLDEADAYCRDNENLRSVLDAGHRRDGAVIRVVGDDHEPRQFSAYAAVALAAIGRLPGTVEDRSIIIRLRRRRPDEPIAPLRLDRTGDLDQLCRRAARWAGDHAAALAEADPQMPPSVYNRAADNWRPLLAIAALAGGKWPQRAREAAAELTSGGDEGGILTMLLADIRAIFATTETDRLASENLVAALVEMDERPWPEFRGGKPISAPQVARLLKPLGISSGSIRLADGRTPKGYHRRAFDDVFARYLSRQNATLPQPKDSAPFTEKQAATNSNGVAFQNRGKPSVSAACGGVADRKPPLWAERL